MVTPQPPNPYGRGPRVVQSSGFGRPRDGDGDGVLQEGKVVKHPGARGGIGYYNEEGRWVYGLRQPTRIPKPPNSGNPRIRTDQTQDIVRRRRGGGEPDPVAAAPEAIQARLRGVAGRYAATAPGYARPQLGVAPGGRLASRRVLLYAEFPEGPAAPSEPGASEGQPFAWWFDVQMGACRACAFFDPGYERDAADAGDAPRCKNPKITAQQFRAALAEREECPGYEAGLDASRLHRPHTDVADLFSQMLLAAMLDSGMAEGVPSNTPLPRVGRSKVVPYTDTEAEKAWAANGAAWDNLVSHRQTGVGVARADAPQLRPVEGEAVTFGSVEREQEREQQKRAPEQRQR